MIFIYSTFPSKNEAKKIGEGLVRKKLAACCNIFPIDSIYSWRGKVVKDKAFAAIIKTKKENFKKVEKFILENDWAKKWVATGYNEKISNVKYQTLNIKEKNIFFNVIVNWLIFWPQYWYMKKKIKKEKIGLHEAFFHH